MMRNLKALDGEHDDFMKRDYERRCQHLRDERLDTLKNECIFAPDACFNVCALSLQLRGYA